MRFVASIVILGLFGSGMYFLNLATHGGTDPVAARNGLIAGLVSWGLGTVLTIIAIFAFRERRP